MESEWDSSAALSYYGGIITACIAVLGVYLTIKYSQKSYKEDARKRVLPFIVIDVLKTKSCIQIVPNIEAEGTRDVKVKGYTEYKLQDYYCILEKGKITYKTALTKQQQELLDNGGTKWVSDASGGRMIVVDDICVPIEIENIGNGAAIRVRYGLNRIKMKDEEKRYLPVISLKTNEPIMFHIFSEDCSKKSLNLGEYILTFYYDDIYSNKYKQEFPIKIEYSTETRRPEVFVDMEHVQERLGGNE